MDPRILEALQNPDPAMRKKAIKALVQTLDPKAPGVLMRVASNDDDGEVRAYAQKAIDFLATKGITATDEDLFNENPLPVYTGDEKLKRDDEKAKRGDEKAKRGGRELVGWGDALLDVTILGLASAALVFFLVLLLVTNISTAIETYSVFAGLSTAEINELYNFLAFVEVGAVPVAFGLGILSAIGAVIGLFFSVAIYHFVATMMLGGDGTFPHMLSMLSRVQVVYTAVVGILYLAMIYLFFQTLPADPAAFEDPAYFARVNGGYNMVSGLASLAGLIYVVAATYYIGKSYDFGFGKGCATQILSYVVLFACSCAFIFTFMAVLGG